jgi:hypothetical protein
MPGHRVATPIISTRTCKYRSVANPISADTLTRHRHGIPSYSPVRPPALPLAVRSPYTNIWTSTVNNGTLNTNGAMFWPGTNVGWEGIITVDGVVYEFLGTGLQSLPFFKHIKTATPVAVEFDSQYSNFTFRAGPVDVVASFFSPVIPQDLCRTSIPLSYLQVSFEATDNQLHEVQIYSDISAPKSESLQWNLFNGERSVYSSSNSSIDASAVYSWVISRKTQYEFAEQ